ncbi:histone-lysine N-methyltransferase, H3 lysine-9 specific SUVH4 [Beta vulgaris subsp. vulgaris]|uniref:histone-lysine N-methyltransferase, H3 lysine-9 specific SUVH4 n=1 Tax=Beta vulgaris subsp. vulgaris TaxID=3555 RepID=UPI002036777D|nr:histone-lysine N-methyltransferase, H3 lysine-9 specific SUVH4 [Beta vulgaris subsp. vulgaris]
MSEIMEVEVGEVKMGETRRTSERTRGKRISYNEKIMASYDEVSPVKMRKTHRSNGGGSRKSSKGPEVVEKVEESREMEIVRGLFGASEGGDGLLNLGLKLEEVQSDSRVSVEKSDHLKVKETLRIFNNHYLHFIQEEERRCKQVEDEKKKKGDADKKRVPHKRPDLKAITKMMETRKVLFPSKQFGAIPGVDVGHQFFSRAEMVAVGFHSHWLNGIDYMGQNYSKGEFSKYTFPLAVAIVLSGQYEDDLDNSDDVIYTGQGGNNLLGDKKQVQDQKLERGNLALKNSMEEDLPVRVIRGHSSKNSYVGKVYTYDGLYKVVNYWAEKGVSGFTVYKFRLKRMEGQPELTTTQVQFIRGRIPDAISGVRGLVYEDISEGQENIPIPATNLVDDPPVPPTGFKYCKSIQLADNVKIPAATRGCDCVGGCTDPKICACARLNGSDFPYVHRDGGRLVEAKAVVFECGPKCACGSSCINRTSQKGLRYRFEVFRTPKKGWGVRSWDYIPAGAPICEYTGMLRRSDEADSVLENNFIFDIDCLQTMKGLDGRQMRLQDVSIPSDSLLEKPEEKVVDSNVEFCIDAGVTGNLARFINHSCEPNLFVQCVLSSHHDIKLARVMLFAADNIPPLQELTYDYGYGLDSVIGLDGKVKQMTCYCGAEGCRKRLF